MDMQYSRGPPPQRPRSYNGKGPGGERGMPGPRPRYRRSFPRNAVGGNRTSQNEGEAAKPKQATQPVANTATESTA